MTVPIVRFAPSPNGYLHLGHAFSALLNYRYVQQQKGQFLLRIEDIDRGRSRPKFEEALYEDLDWLGIKWVQPVRRQSEHFEDYEAAARKLSDLGLLYPCAASRKEIMAYIASLPNADNYPRDPDGNFYYPGLYKDRTVSAQELQDKPHAKRLNMVRAIALLEADAVLSLCFKTFDCHSIVGKIAADREEGERNVLPQMWGDIVLARKDVPTSYHLSVVVDDALQGVTHVIRGKDLEPAISIHVLLQSLLGLKTPLYCHHDLIRTDQGQKLSKSAGDISLRALRKSGWTADDVKARLFEEV